MTYRNHNYDDYYEKDRDDLLAENENLFEEDDEEKKKDGSFEDEEKKESSYEDDEYADDEDNDDDDDDDFAEIEAPQFFYDKNNPVDFTELMKDYNSGISWKMDAASDKAIKALDGWIRSIIHKKYSRYARRYFDDLLQQGYLGVCKGLKAYDPGKSKPSTFFYYYILHEMQDWINTMVNKTTSHYDACVRKIKKIIDRYNEEGRPYTVIDISIEAKIPVQTVEESLQIINGGELSIDSSIDTTNSSLEHILPSEEKTPEQIYIEQENLLILDEAIHRYLDVEEVRVIELMFGIHGCAKLNNKAISKELDMPTDKIRRYQVSAFCKLRNSKELRSLHKDMLRNTLLEIDEENAIPLLSDIDLDAALDIMKDVEIDF